MSEDQRLVYLNSLKEKTQVSGGQDKIDIQHQRGKLTARERLDLLFDRSSFHEFDALILHRSMNLGMENQKFLGDGVIAGWGTIEGRLIYAYAQDFTILGGSLGEAQARKICKIMDLALKNGAPLVALNDSGGARIQEGVASLAGYGEIFLRNTLASGVVPQIAAIMGPCAGGAVYSPALMDFIVMVRTTSNMFVTGPDVIKAVTHEQINAEELGGADVHAERSGVCHLASATDQDALFLIRQLLSYLPQNNMEDPPFHPTEDDALRMDESLNTLVPVDPSKPYDVKEIIRLIVDDKVFFEVQEGFAQNLVIGFARLGGHSIGIVANQPAILAGVLNIESSDKAARFVRLCDCFNLPILTLVDVPGFMPGIDQEHGGIIRSGAKLLHAYCEATVPKITLILRKAYGGAYIVMSSKHMRGDINFAWPGAEIAVMGPEGAVNILFKKELASAANPESRRAELIEQYRDKYANPYIAAELGYIDDVIEPKQTRPRLINTLEMLQNKRDQNPSKKHGNIPL